MHVNPQAFRRMDERPDEDFYAQARLVTHIDDAAIAAVTQLYREYFPPLGTILDLMSSWISHLPPEVKYQKVVGLGMNETELARNPRLDTYLVQNLNTHPTLDMESEIFDGAGICVSVDYLIKPLEVFAELARVMKPGAPLVITFSNRCFPSKAIAAWLSLDGMGKMQLVGQYFKQTGQWTEPELLDRSPSPGSDPLWAVIARKRDPGLEKKQNGSTMG